MDSSISKRSTKLMESIELSNISAPPAAFHLAVPETGTLRLSAFDRIRPAAYKLCVAPMNLFNRLALVAGLSLSLTAHAQLAPPKPEPVIGARQPALSPDGKRLAFVYRG